jgi:hypothetical protein
MVEPEHVHVGRNILYRAIRGWKVFLGVLKWKTFKINLNFLKY